MPTAFLDANYALSDLAVFLDEEALPADSELSVEEIVEHVQQELRRAASVLEERSTLKPDVLRYEETEAGLLPIFGPSKIIDLYGYGFAKRLYGLSESYKSSGAESLRSILGKMMNEDRFQRGVRDSRVFLNNCPDEPTGTY